MGVEWISNKNQGTWGVVNVQLLMSISTKCLPVAPLAPKLKYSTQNAFLEFFMCLCKNSQLNWGDFHILDIHIQI